MPNPNVGLFSVPAAQAAATCSPSARPLQNGQCNPALDPQSPIYTSYDNACWGTFETNCTDKTDTAGTYDDVQCPTLFIYSGCHTQGYQAASEPYMVSFDQTSNGAYCFCVPGPIHYYGPNNETLMAKRLLGLHLNPGGQIAFLEGNAGAFSSNTECYNKCYGMCIERAARAVGPFLNTFFAAYE